MLNVTDPMSALLYIIWGKKKKKKLLQKRPYLNHAEL